MSTITAPGRSQVRALRTPIALTLLAALAACEGQLTQNDKLDPSAASAPSAEQEVTPSDSEAAPAIDAPSPTQGAPVQDVPVQDAPSSEPKAELALDELEGSLDVYVTHFEDTSTTSYDLLTKSGKRHSLSVQGEPALATGDELRVRGKLLADGRFEVASYSVLNDEEERQLRVLALVQNGVRLTNKVAALMVHFGTPDSLTKETLRANLFGTGLSAAELHKEASYNLNKIEGEVFGWLQVPAMTNCDTRTLATNALAAAQSAGIDLSGYGQIAYYFPKSSQCSWSGLAQVGRPTRPARESWFNGNAGCGVLAHELGHNIGAQHARSYDCGSSVVGGTCTYSEYGDPFDVMGSGSCSHFGGYVKAAEGWYGGCNTVTVTADGSFDLAPIELPSNAIQTLRVPMDASLCPSGLTSCYYYLEYRQPLGKFHSRLSATSPVFQGILVRVGSTVDFSGAGRPQAPYLLDMTPGSRSSDFQDAPLGVGKSFTDSKGVRITLSAASSTAAKVAITFPGGGSGSPTCIDGSTPGQSTPPTTPPPTPPTTPPPTNGCASGETSFNGRCYVKVSASSYDAALSSCQNRGTGYGLAEIESAQENQFVASLVGSQESWLGASDRSREGTWTWQSGARFYGPIFYFFSGPLDGRYTNFVSGEPNDGGGNSDCLRMVSGGGWRDGNCSESFPAICEK